MRTPVIPIEARPRFRRYIDRRGLDECWNWQGKLWRGYGRFKVRGRYYQAHRAMMALIGEPIPAGLFVCHHCDNRRCVNPKHLFFGTHLDNMTDMKAKERQARGERINNARLTAKNVREIRSSTESTPALARRYGVGVSTIGGICRGETWPHVPGQSQAVGRPCGERLSKLKVEQVRAIRASAEPAKVLARRYGVSVANITAIRRGETWGHLPGTSVQALHGSCGTGNSSAKLTERDVLEIRSSREIGRVLGARYGVSAVQINNIRRGVAWAHVS